MQKNIIMYENLSSIIRQIGGDTYVRFRYKKSPPIGSVPPDIGTYFVTSYILFFYFSYGVGQKRK